MRSKPSAQVIGESYVELPREADTFEKVNVDHFNAAPVFALRATTDSLRAPSCSLAMFRLRRLACQHVRDLLRPSSPFGLRRAAFAPLHVPLRCFGCEGWPAST